MTFYHACLGGSLDLARLGDTPMKAQFPPGQHDRIINAHLTNGAIDISGADWMASPDLAPLRGNMSALFVSGSSHDGLRAIFDRLARGAARERFQDLHDMPFGVYGQFYDRYGVQWIFRGDPTA